jgi:hypothetical protein
MRLTDISKFMVKISKEKTTCSREGRIVLQLIMRESGPVDFPRTGGQWHYY